MNNNSQPTNKQDPDSDIGNAIFTETIDTPTIERTLNSVPLDDNEIADIPLFIPTTDSNTPITNVNNKDIVINNTQTPVLIPPSNSSSSNASSVQNLTPLNMDQQNESYSMTGYYKNSSANKIVSDTAEKPVSKDDLLNNINIENGKITEEIANHELIHPNALITSSQKQLLATTYPKKKSNNSQPAKRPAFVVKLWKMVNDPSNDHYICWVDDGKAFQVKDRENFMKYILPKYFKHNNLASFIRQLNMYGWHKIQDVTSGALISNEDILQFENPNFLKGREDLLDNIVRNKPSKEHEDEETDIKQLMSQLEQMKRSQLLITEDLRRVRQDNELLWKENFIARERHKIQSETLEKIMRFLASIYGNNTSRLLEEMDSHTGDLVELDDHNRIHRSNHHHNDISNHYNPTHYQNDYGYYVSTGSTGNDLSNNSSHSNINGATDVNNQSYNQNTGQYNNRRMNQIQSQTYPPSTPRRPLMITEQSHDFPPSSSSNTTVHTTRNSSTVRSNELRMDNIGSIPTQAEALDSTIQEIQRGPETFNNSQQSITSYVHPARQYANQQQQQQQQQSGYSQHNQNHIISSFNTTDPTTNRRSITSINGGPTPGTVSSVPMFDSADPGDSLNTSKGSTNAPQVMGNIHQKLHEHQGTLKQVHEWLNKYNDNLETDNISLPDDFKVDDFLQQPLDMGNSPATGTTPVDFNGIDGFINVDTPVQTPVMAQSPLNLNNLNKNPLEVPTPISSDSSGGGPALTNSNKRTYTQSNLGESVINDVVDPSGDIEPSKRFRPVQ